MIASIPLAVVFALVALFSAVELIWRRPTPDLVSYVADREALATHLVMNGAMAAMFAPFFDREWAVALQIVCAGAIALLVARLFWPDRGRPPGRAAGTVFHLLALAVMIWAIRAMPVGMTDMAMTPHRSWPALALAALFLVEGLATAALAALAPTMLMRMANIAARRIDDQPRPGASPIAAVRLAAVPHVVMDAGMVLMLVPLG